MGAIDILYHASSLHTQFGPVDTQHALRLILLK